MTNELSTNRNRIAGVAAALLGASLALVGTAPAIAAGGVSHEAALIDGGSRSTVTLHAGSGAAGHRMSVLILDEDADFDRPAAADIVYLNELALDAAGDATFTFAIPQAHLDAYAIAVNTDSISTARYVASLDPAGSLPTTPETPGGGTPGSPGAGGSGGSGSNGSAGRGGSSNGEAASEAPTGAPTAEPTRQPTDGPSPSTDPGDSDEPEASGPQAEEQGADALLWVVGVSAVLVAAAAAVVVWLIRRRGWPQRS